MPGTGPKGKRVTSLWWHVMRMWLVALSNCARKILIRLRIFHRAGHNAGVLSPEGPSPVAQALLLLQNSLKETLDLHGVLGLSTENVRDVLFVEDEWRPRFVTFQGGTWDKAQTLELLGSALITAFNILGQAMLSSVQHQDSDLPSLVLAGVQVSAMNARAKRGHHFDNPLHGHLVVSLTISGSGKVTFSDCAAEPEGVSHESAGTWYALDGIGLTDYSHSIQTFHEPRLSVTYRYIEPSCLSKITAEHLASGLRTSRRCR